MFYGVCVWVRVCTRACVCVCVYGVCVRAWVQQRELDAMDEDFGVSAMMEDEVRRGAGRHGRGRTANTVSMTECWLFAQCDLVIIVLNIMNKCHFRCVSVNVVSLEVLHTYVF